jgi:hypothetical protein
MKPRHLVLIIALFIFTAALIYLLNVKAHQSELAIRQNELLDEDSPLVWLGPGFYYGEFFSLKSEYEEWQKANIPMESETLDKKKEQNKG